jgi:tRNA pseudouridine38-40 synthase
MGVYRIDLGYDGTRFRGYARQAKARTVQGELERALMTVLARREPPATSVAGRTDAGVHATGQVVSFATLEPVDIASLEKSLNTMLGPEIVIYQISPAADDFDARLSARWRAYRYRILNRPRHDPFRAAVTYWFADPLDADLMNQGVAHLIGAHDFASLCRARGGKTTDREIYSAEWSRREDEIVLDIAARAFCHQLVRSIVALSVDIGRGKIDPEAVPGILESRDRNSSRGTAPPHGLVLCEVGY